LSGGIFASLSGLRKLIFSSNHITGINDNAFVGLDSLEDLYLDHNDLSRVPSIALQSLKRLRLLSLSGNSMTIVSTGDFVHSSLEQIFIDHCPFLVLVDRGSFWDLPGLKEIHLDSNPRLEFLHPQAFVGVPSVIGIFLHNNTALQLTVNDASIINESVILRQQRSGHSLHNKLDRETASLIDKRKRSLLSRH
jgi:Leucine-rich repeat (LRR) protein